ncbi:MAG: radical SAM protein, partial [Anaerolineales bacterium]
MAESEYVKYISHREIKQRVEWIEVDEAGRLIIPPDVAREMGIIPGAQLRIEPANNGLKLHRPVTHLTKVYVEPTNACNLDCLTCFRQGWDDKLGKMTERTFQRILEGIQDFEAAPTLYFGGIGEPLANKYTIDWVERAKAQGLRVEMITNGTLLDATRLRRLVDAGLDLLWVSIDGARPESYADIRLGAEL